MIDMKTDDQWWREAGARTHLAGYYVYDDLVVISCPRCSAIVRWDIEQMAAHRAFHDVIDRLVDQADPPILWSVG